MSKYDLAHLALAICIFSICISIPLGVTSWIHWHMSEWKFCPVDMPIAQRLLQIEKSVNGNSTHMFRFYPMHGFVSEMHTLSDLETEWKTMGKQIQCEAYIPWIWLQAALASPRTWLFYLRLVFLVIGVFAVVAFVLSYTFLGVWNRWLRYVAHFFGSFSFTVAVIFSWGQTFMIRRDWSEIDEDEKRLHMASVLNAWFLCISLVSVMGAIVYLFRSGQIAHSMYTFKWH